MTPILAFFITAVVLLIALLLWAIRPTKIRLKSTDAVFETLSAPRHYYRLPQILHALHTKDTEFIQERGYPGLLRWVRSDRKRIALNYLEFIETDYEILMEASRVLAAMAPEVVAAHEWERFRLSMRFTWNCRLLRWRLKTGLRPWSSFARISEMANELSYRLEQATTQIGQRAVLPEKFPSLPQ
jgi:hypothetical protein